MTTVKKGDRFLWSGLPIRVMRVATSGFWADIKVQPDSDRPWGKRQPLPLPASFRRVTDAAEPPLCGLPPDPDSDLRERLIQALRTDERLFLTGSSAVAGIPEVIADIVLSVLAEVRNG